MREKLTSVFKGIDNLLSEETVVPTGLETNLAMSRTGNSEGDKTLTVRRSKIIDHAYLSTLQDHVRLVIKLNYGSRFFSPASPI